MEKLTVVYGDTTLDAPIGTDLNELRSAMSEIFPELKTAEVVQTGNTITFQVKAGTKGADNMEKLTVVYGDTTLDAPIHTDLNELKVAMSEIFPELKTAQAVREGNTVRFEVKAGTKGSDEKLTVVYGDTTLDAPSNTDLNELKVAMSEIFPELKTAEVVREGNTVRFQVKAGTKGSDDTLTVIYGDTSLSAPSNTDLNELKVAMSEIFPELKTAQAIREGNTVRFEVKAGTKGSDETLKVVYGDTTLTAPSNTNLDELKTAMSEIFPELKTAQAVREGNTVRFEVKAGTKGK